MSTGNKSAVLQIRLSPTELNTIRENAQRNGKTVSELVRSLATQPQSGAATGQGGERHG
jgi:hypothetical protein